MYYHNKGDALATLGDTDAADQCFQAALQQEPGNVIYLTSHERMLATKGNYKDADEIMTRVCKTEPAGTGTLVQPGKHAL
mgnify:CR=1 FL=1